jgi:hypothetical protein
MGEPTEKNFLYEAKKSNLAFYIAKTGLEKYLTNLQIAITDIHGKATCEWNDGGLTNVIEVELLDDSDCSVASISEKMAGSFSENTMESFKISVELEGVRKNGGESWSGSSEFPI